MDALTTARRLGPWPALVLALLGVGTAAYAGHEAVSPGPAYAASASVLLQLDRAPSVDALGLGSTYVRTLAPTYAALATTPEVLEPVVRTLALPMAEDQLARRVSVAVSPDGVVLDLTATDERRDRAARIADAAAAGLGTAIAGGAAHKSGTSVLAHPLGPAQVHAAAPHRLLVIGSLTALALALLGTAAALLVPVRRTEATP